MSKKFAGRKFADHVKDMQQTGPASNTAYKPRRKQIYGSSQSNRLKCVQTVRTVDVFLSRLHPSTKDAEIIDCVNVQNVQNVTCNQLSSRYADLYSSVHVSIQVDASDFAKAIDLFMSAQSWPCGVFVRRYFKPKNGGE